LGLEAYGDGKITCFASKVRSLWVFVLGSLVRLASDSAASDWGRAIRAGKTVTWSSGLKHSQRRFWFVQAAQLLTA